MTLKVFTQPNCPKCSAAKKIVDDSRLAFSDLRIESYDVTTVDGLAEASFYSVMATPSIVLLNDAGKEVHAWRGEVPSLKEIVVLIR